MRILNRSFCKQKTYPKVVKNAKFYGVPLKTSYANLRQVSSKFSSKFIPNISSILTNLGFNLSFLFHILLQYQNFSISQAFFTFQTFFTPSTIFFLPRNRIPRCHFFIIRFKLETVFRYLSIENHRGSQV